MTRKEFLTQYPVMDKAAEVKAKMLDALGITPEEFDAAIQRAGSDVAESRNLLKLVRGCRKKNAAPKD